MIIEIKKSKLLRYGFSPNGGPTTIPTENGEACILGHLDIGLGISHLIDRELHEQRRAHGLYGEIISFLFNVNDNPLKGEKEFNEVLSNTNIQVKIVD